MWCTVAAPSSERTEGRAAPAPAGYRVEGDHVDEAFRRDGEPRGAYAAVLAALEDDDLARLGERVRARARDLGLEFGKDRELAVDPVPRLIESAEWESLQAGLAQRARALNAFLLDAYGEQRIFAEGLVPRRLLETSGGYEPAMRGLLADDVPPATVAGLDLIRDRHGELRVLEDNLRMPSGAAYAIGVREAVEPELGAGLSPRPLEGYLEALRVALRAAAPHGQAEPAAAILSEGPAGSAWYEHRRLGRALDIPVVTSEELEVSRGRLFARRSRRRRQVDVLYRRLDEDRLSERDGSPTALGELLLPALRSRRLRCVNAFGTALGDDKLAHAYVEAMVRFYLREEPLLRSVPSFDLGEEGARGAALQRLEELVIKPRDAFGGHGVTIMPHAGEPQRRRAIALVRRRPEGFVAQETVELSTHPTVCGGRLRPRRVDLRPFVLSGAGWTTAMTGGLTRFARGAGEMVVNSSRGGGCKDTWVLPGEAGARR